MPVKRDDTEERRERLNGMIAAFRAARQRRLVAQGLTLWKSAETELEHRALDSQPATASTKH